MRAATPDVPLGQLLEKLIDYRGKTPVKSPSGIKLITAKVIKDGRIEDDNHEFIAEADYDSWMRRGLPHQWDILITTEAPLGELAMLRTNERIALAQRVILLRANAEVADQQYLFQALKSPLVQARLSARATGTTVLGIKQSELVKVEIPLPTLSTQRRIASILSAYDDLIENNTRRIAILEEMARRIYEEWFVRFRYPGHEGVQMVESELGLVPEEWTVVPMSTIADVIDCLHSKKPAENSDAGGILLQLSNIADDGLLDMSERYMVSVADYQLWTNRMEASEGDCVVTNVGRVGAVAQIPRGVNAALGRNMTGVRVKPKTISPVYLLRYLLSSHMSKEVAKKKDPGTIMDSLNVKGIVKLAIPIGDAVTMAKFDDLAGPMRRKVEVLASMNANLRITRDLLLPKLISGELDMSELPLPEVIAA